MTDSALFGGAGDQRGTGIAAEAGSIYVSGDAQPEDVASSSALVLSYPTGSQLSPAWQRSFGFGSSFHGIAASGGAVDTAGSSYSLSTDNVGDKESKSIAVQFSPDGSDGAGAGGSIWETAPNFFVYTGIEQHLAVTTATENGATVVYAGGYGQPNGISNAYVAAKYDDSGHLVASATDSSVGIGFNSFNGNGSSVANAVAVVDGGVYLAGYSDWSSDGDTGAQPAVWKYDPNLNLVWRLKDSAEHGVLTSVTNIGSSLFAVGAVDSGAGNEDFLMEKFDEAGNVIWKTIVGGTGNDQFNGVTSVGNRLFAVGYTASMGAGGQDAVLAEIDPNTGGILSETLFGGAGDDVANGIATDGQNLYVVGQTRSFAAPDGNAVGENDGMLLRYSLATTSVALDGSGNLVITDVASGGKDDNLTVSYNAANKQYVLTDPTAVFSTAIGATNGPNEVDVPAADVTGKIEVHTGAGNDTLTVNYKHPPAGGLSYDGGSGDNTLKVNNATAKATDTWLIKGLDAGSVGKISFSSVAHLIGGAGPDVFKMFAAGKVTTIDGGGAPSGQGNWLDYTPTKVAVSVNLATAAATNIGGGANGEIVNIQNVRGGAGNDTLTGDAQGNILVGGAGNDVLNGGSGLSLLIGGKGADTINGGSGGDLIIGDYTKYDTNNTALMDILAEWQSAKSYAARISDIENGGGLNKSFVLDYGNGTVIDDKAADQLYGGVPTSNPDDDWFFQGVAVADTVFNWETGEIISQA